MCGVIWCCICDTYHNGSHYMTHTYDEHVVWHVDTHCSLQLQSELQVSCPILHWKYAVIVIAKLSLAEHKSQMIMFKVFFFNCTQTKMNVIQWEAFLTSKKLTQLWDNHWIMSYNRKTIIIPKYNLCQHSLQQMWKSLRCP